MRQGSMAELPSAVGAEHLRAYGPAVGRRVLRWLGSRSGLRVLSVAAVLALWQWYGSRPDVFALAPFTRVGAALVRMVTSGEVVRAALGTLGIAAQGYALATVLGILGGFATGISAVARNTLDPIVNALYTAPMTLLIPVIGIWIGLGTRGKLFLVFMFSVFVILVNTAAGVRSVDPGLMETARSFGARRLKLYRDVLLPWSLPFILTGMRLGVGRAIRGAIVADMLLISSNLGRYLLEAGSTYRMDVLLAGILFTMLLGYGLMALARWIESRALRWRPVQRW